MAKATKKEFARGYNKFIVQCPCGMTSEFRSLVHVDENREYTESPNFKYYFCDDCGRLIDRTSLEVVEN